jgi:hypothetical protein
MLLTRETLLERLRYHVKRSTEIDVAVAWAHDCDALSSLIDFANTGASLRAIVGIWGNATHPNALRLLKAHLRIATSAEGLFHPKFYLFHQHTGRIGWIGSANLTRPGFQQNEELVFEFADEDSRALKWFDQLWNSLPKDCGPTLDMYAANWQPPPPPPRSPSTPAENNRRRTQRGIYKLGRELTDWRSFVEAIGEADRFWGKKFKRNQPVIGEDTSWLSTITFGHPIVCRADWDDLTQEDRYFILGGSSYGWLGSMGAAGIANNVFKEPTPDNLRIRRKIRAALEPVLEADDQFADAACGFIAAVDEIPHFSGGIATRMLALARPNRAISVNNASRRHLAELTKLPAYSLAHSPAGRAHSYKDMLQWFEDKPWYSQPSPEGPYEQLLADNRAALFDVLVYDDDE